MYMTNHHDSLHGGSVVHFSVPLIITVCHYNVVNMSSSNSTILQLH